MQTLLLKELPVRDSLSVEDLKAISKLSREPCLSIFMPAVRASSQNQQNPIRFKKLLRQAERSMEECGFDGPEISEWLDAPKKLLEESLFWQHQSRGFAVLLSKNFSSAYRLSIEFEEKVVLNSHFHIKPFLPLFVGQEPFHVLALSQHHTRLFKADRDDITEIEVPGLPKSIDEALKYDVRERQELHTTPLPRGSALSNDPGTEDGERILRFFHQVDKAVRSYLNGSESRLALFGVDYLHSIYHRANSYPHLLADGLEGSPEGVHPAEIQQKAWELVEPLFSKKVEDEIEFYKQLRGEGLRSSENLKEILNAAVQGRVQTLFLSKNAECWGKFNPETLELEIHPWRRPGDEELWDYAALQTLWTDGTVYLTEPGRLPGHSEAACIFRY